MDLPRLIEALSDPAAYPHPVGEVEVRQTHISAVFLAGPCAYKIKKPVNLGFLDFSTLEKRLHFCEEEVRLNRRLAPDVYLGVVPVRRDGQGLQFEAEGEVVEWAVKMRRLPDEATLQERLRARRGRRRTGRGAGPPDRLLPPRCRGERADRVLAGGSRRVAARSWTSSLRPAPGRDHGHPRPSSTGS